MLAVRDLRGVAIGEAFGYIREAVEDLPVQLVADVAASAPGGAAFAGAADHEALVLGEAACLAHDVLPVLVFLRRWSVRTDTPAWSASSLFVMAAAGLRGAALRCGLSSCLSWSLSRRGVTTSTGADSAMARAGSVSPS